MFYSFSKVTGRSFQSKAAGINLKCIPATCHTPPWKDNGSRTHSCLSSRLHLDFYPPRSVKSLSLIFGQRRGPTEHEVSVFFVLMVLCNNQGSCRDCCCNLGIRWHPAGKRKKQNTKICVCFCQAASCCGFPVAPDSLKVSGRLCLAVTFYKHPLASEPRLSLCPEPWPVNMWYFALVWRVVPVCLRHKSKWPVPMQPQQRGPQHPKEHSKQLELQLIKLQPTETSSHQTIRDKTASTHEGREILTLAQTVCTYKSVIRAKKHPTWLRTSLQIAYLDSRLVTTFVQSQTHEHAHAHSCIHTQHKHT